ncbi:MAG: M20/M25/M40 family metallo-hydrolase, partial [Leifsonia sp.]
MGDGEATDFDTEVVALVRSLVSIPSVNPAVDASGSGEAAIAAACARWLEDRGFSVTLIGRDPRRPSVLAVAGGTGGGRSLMINGHLDTVGVEGFAGDPFAADAEDGRLRGRGAYDMKSGLAAAMVAAARAGSTPLRGDVVVTLVADEEFGSSGTEDALARLLHDGTGIDGAVVVEPTGLAITVAHRGFAWYRLDITGSAAHGSQPELGADAIAAATEFLVALRAFGHRLAARTPHPLLGDSTVRVSRIDGGTDAATVAARCTVTVERRTLPGESHDGVLAELSAVLATAAAGLPDGIRYAVTELVSRPAFEAADDSAIVASVSAAVLEETGTVAARRGDPWWTDA